MEYTNSSLEFLNGKCIGWKGLYLNSLILLEIGLDCTLKMFLKYLLNRKLDSSQIFSLWENLHENTCCENKKLAPNAAQPVWIMARSAVLLKNTSAQISTYLFIFKQVYSNPHLLYLSVFQLCMFLSIILPLIICSSESFILFSQGTIAEPFQHICQSSVHSCDRGLCFVLD